MTTRIRNADIVIAYDPAADDHVYRRNLDVVFDASGILHLGEGYTGEVTREIDGRGFMVMPGLVDIHSHPSSEPGNKGMTDEVGTPKLYNSSLYEFLWLFRADAEGIPHLNHVAWSELLMSGVTTLVDLSFPSDGWLRPRGGERAAHGDGADVPQRPLVHPQRLHGRGAKQPNNPGGLGRTLESSPPGSLRRARNDGPEAGL
ncbi:hypothetical protein AB4Z10_22980 [Bosea sp. RAF48]|uniref:hypothetical protein n=1 Tax=Bosea sp. RAF48 TaxID=3237480 RepID=UPI003F8EDCA3